MMEGIQNTNVGEVKGNYVDTPYGRFLNISDKLMLMCGKVSHKNLTVTHFSATAKMQNCRK